MYFAFSIVAPSILTGFCRPTGWHGESGAAGAGGHITVDFQRRDGRHVTTHHVYRMDVKVRYLNGSADLSRP